MFSAVYSALASWLVSAWSALTGARRAPARRALAACVAAVLAVGCLESVVEAGSITSRTADVACVAGGWGAANGATADAPTSDCDGRPGDHPASAGHRCPCARAVVAVASAPPVAVLMVAPSVAPIVREDRVPPSPAPERRVRPPVTRSV